MNTRREFIAGAGALGVAAPLLAGCSLDSGDDAAAIALRRPETAPVHGAAETHLQRELVRLATLAPSSHNTQCWRFRAGDRLITLEPDFARRCPVVDPDDHHLFVSLGCATENLAQAALAHGLHADARFELSESPRIAVRLESTRRVDRGAVQAILERQCTRGDYDGRPLTSEEQRQLEQAATGTGVRAIFLTDRTAMESVLEFVVAANTRELENPAFIAELKQWIRFSAGEARRTGDGLFAGASGNLATPRWLGSRLMDVLLSPSSDGDRYSRQIRGSAGIVVFASQSDDATHWVEAGRCYERFALRATTLGIRTAFLNQPVEIASMRGRFAASLGLTTERPDLVVRFGRGPAMPWSLRRPVEAVLA